MSCLAEYLYISAYPLDAINKATGNVTSGSMIAILR